MKIKKTHAYLLGGLLAVAVLALVGNTIWNTVVLPSLGQASSLSLYLAVGIGFIGGLVSFFAPCGLALLPAFLSYNLAAVDEGGKTHLGKIGFAASAGIMTFFLLLGILFSTIGSAVNQYITPVQYIIAILFILFGYMLYTDTNLISGLFEGVRETVHREAKETGGYTGFYIFGFAYGLDAIGCLFPLVFALMLLPVMSGQLITGLAAFIAYSLGLGIMFTLFAYGILYGKEEIVQTREHAETIRKIAGIGLVVGGLLLLTYYILFGMPIAA